MNKGVSLNEIRLFFDALKQSKKNNDMYIIIDNDMCKALYDLCVDCKKENDRLNNIINELENYINGRIDVLTVSVDNKSKDQYFNNKCIGGVQELKNVLDKLKD